MHDDARSVVELALQFPLQSGDLAGCDATLSDAVQAVAMDVEPNTLGAPNGAEAVEWEEFDLTARSPGGSPLRNGPSRTLDGVARRAADLEAAGWQDVVVTRRRLRTTRWASEPQTVSAARLRLAAARADGGGRGGG